MVAAVAAAVAAVPAAVAVLAPLQIDVVEGGGLLAFVPVGGQKVVARAAMVTDSFCGSPASNWQPLSSWEVYLSIVVDTKNGYAGSAWPKVETLFSL